MIFRTKMDHYHHLVCQTAILWAVQDSHDEHHEKKVFFSDVNWNKNRNRFEMNSSVLAVSASPNKYTVPSTSSIWFSVGYLAAHNSHFTKKHHISPVECVDVHRTRIKSISRSRGRKNKIKKKTESEQTLCSQFILFLQSSNVLSSSFLFLFPFLFLPQFHFSHLILYSIWKRTHTDQRRRHRQPNRPESFK